MQAAAFFDLDNTLINANCGLRTLVHYFFSGKIGLFQAFRMGISYLLYKLRGSDPVRFFSSIYRFMEGRSYEQESKACSDFFTKNLEKRIFLEAKELVEEHRQKGHLIVIITNSVEFKINRIRELLSPDIIIATTLKTDKGLFTGEVERVSFGKNKLKFAKELAEEKGIDLKASYAYSDNSSDIALLDAIGHPVAVNPQPRLKRYARQKGWKILRFRRKGGLK